MTNAKQKSPAPPVTWTISDALGDIASLCAAWAERARRLDAAMPYCGPDYLLATLRTYHSNARPQLVSAHEGDRLLGLLPLVERPLRRSGLTLREIGLPNNPNVINSSALIDPADPAAPRIATALLTGALSLKPDSLLLDHLPCDGTAALFAKASARLGARAEAPRAARSLHYTSLGSGWDSYLATRSRNHRWQIRKALKSADEAGLTVARITGAGALRHNLPAWFDVESRSWQAGDPTSAMQDRDRAFHMALLAALPPDALGDLWLVRAGERPLAALRMLAAPGKVSVHTMHFDAGARDNAPGVLAFAHMMRAACADGLTEVDMHGRTEFFGRWATGHRDHESLRIFAPGLRGRLLAALSAGRRALQADSLPE